MPRRPELWLPRGRRWSAGAIGISVAVHALLFLVKIGAHLPPSRLPPAQVYLFPPDAEGATAFETTDLMPGGAAKKGPAAGVTARPTVEAPAPEPEPRVEEPVPVEVPAEVPPAQPVDTPSTPRPRPPVPTARIGPSLGEGKLWVRPLPAPPRDIARELTRSHVDLVDSAVAAIVQLYIDSMLTAPAAAGAGLPSWTTQIAGKTFGIDSKYIYLGSLRIPSAILALLPIKGGTSMEYSQASRLSMIREDLQRASARAQTMEDFKRAIRELRAERERLRELERNQRIRPDSVKPEER